MDGKMKVAVASVLTALALVSSVLGQSGARTDDSAKINAFSLNLISDEWTTLDFPGAIETGGTSITSSGDIIGGRYVTSDGLVHGFIWRKGQYSSIDFPGAFSTEGTWLNDRGEIVGAYNNGANHAFLLKGGEFATIDYPGHVNTIATNIGADGTIVGVGSSAGIGFEGFILRHGTFIPVQLQGPSIAFQEPTDIAANLIVGGYFDNLGLHGYMRDRQKRFHTVDCPGATGGVFLSGNDPVGRMLGGMITADGHQHGVLVSEGICIAVDFPESTASYVNAINGRGDIVGRYTDPSGHTHAFVVKHFVGNRNDLPDLPCTHH